MGVVPLVSKEMRLISDLLSVQSVGKRALIRVASGDVARDLGAFFQIAVDDDIGRGRAIAIGLLKTAIAAIEARDHLLATGSGRRFGVDQRLRLVAPFLALIAVAYAAQEMQRAENFRQAL